MPEENAERIDWTDSAAPAYIQLAEILRRRVAAGKSDKPVQLPAAQVIANQFGVSQYTARKAMGRLRDDGLLVTKQGRPGAYIRQAPEWDTAPLRVGDRVRTDVPTAEERKEHQLQRGVKMYRITRPDGDVDSYPDDAYELVVVRLDPARRKQAP